MIIYSIYKIVNILNGKIYIGFTSKIKPIRRWYEHVNSANNGSNILLHRAIRKYGIDNFIFTVIYQSLDRDYTLRVMEPKFISEYKTFSKTGYNLTSGGEGTFGFTKAPWNKDKVGIYSLETLKKLSEKAKKRISPRIGTKHSTETKIKMRDIALQRMYPHPSEKCVITPAGQFNSMKAAAAYYGKSSSWMTKQLRLYPLEFKMATYSLS